MRTTPWIAAAVLAATLAAPPANAQEASGDAIPVDADASALAPGVDLESFDRWEDQGWIRGDAAVIDINDTGGAEGVAIADGEILRLATRAPPSASPRTA